MVMIGATDITRATRASATTTHCLLHRRNHSWMLSHAQIIIGTPNRHIAGSALKVIGGTRKLPSTTFQIGKIPIVAILFQLVELIFEKTVKRHSTFLSLASVKLTLPETLFKSDRP
jgi:hypothetical protein